MEPQSKIHFHILCEASEILTFCSIGDKQIREVLRLLKWQHK
jgi:hypothetical protein